MKVLFLILMLLSAAVVQAAEPASGHVLVIEPARVDLGTVLEGKAVSMTLLLRNTGDEAVYIAGVETSCGCTTAEPESRVIDPGAFTRLQVHIDTTIKRGEVRKTVTVTDDKGHRAEALLMLTVRANPHATMGSSRSIFAAKCASCHGDPARGKTEGHAIYAAVCGMCHGAKAEGGYAPLLRGRNAGLVRDVLYHGLGEHMPAFYEGRGGPLTDVQIRELSRWLSAMR